MTIWDPFDPVTYFLHTILGGLGIVGAVTALSAVKGSTKHIWAGRLFVGAAFVAAATAIAFSFTAFSAAAIGSGALTFSALAAALLALRPKSRAVFVAEVSASVLVALSFLWMGLGVVLSIQSGGWLMPLLYSLFPLSLFIGDIRFLRLNGQERSASRLPRHYSRMAFALAIAVHAPIVSFGDDLGLHPAVAFFGPFVIWPAIVFFFRRRNASRSMGPSSRHKTRQT